MPKCKGCGSEILWFKTVRGELIPADPKRLLVLVPDKSGLVTIKSGYISHFATCPKAAQFRKRGDNDRG